MKLLKRQPKETQNKTKTLMIKRNYLIFKLMLVYFVQILRLFIDYVSSKLIIT